MSDTYVECLVKAKDPVVLKFLKYVLYGLVALCVIGMFLNPILFFAALILGVVAYFVSMYCDSEYEYLYLDREITVDKVLAKTKRKRVATFNVDRMEILAPMNSYHLDGFKNRDVKSVDYSAGQTQPESRYVMYYEGGQKVLLTPNEDMIKAIRNVAPRKVFMD
ncbi:MAG: hypothetical protein IJ335_07925 [Lachnospiraceae bacterium]|nr:hypothetical protein [Lachnospiraceae bacterium]